MSLLDGLLGDVAKNVLGNLNAGNNPQQSQLLQTAMSLIQQNGGTSPPPSSVALGLQRDIVSAMNRGIALLGPSGTTGRTAGDTSAYWGTEGNWYPEAMSNATAPQNQFSLFMHTATVNGVLIFTAPGLR